MYQETSVINVIKVVTKKGTCVANTREQWKALPSLHITSHLQCFGIEPF